MKACLNMGLVKVNKGHAEMRVWVSYKNEKVMPQTHGEFGELETC